MDKFKSLFGLFLTLAFSVSSMAYSQVNSSGTTLPAPLEPLNSKHSQTVLTLPKHWRQRWIDEPIFENKVHVIETGVKGAPTLLLIHGLGYSGLRDWLNVIPALEKNYHVVALDLPGFGQSDPTSLQLAPQKYAQLLAWLVPQLSTEPVTVIGHSMGGAISLRFAANYSKFVKKLIMVDTAGVLQRSVFVFHMTQVPNHYPWLEPYASVIKPLDELVSRVTNFINRVRVSVISRIDQYPDPAKILMENKFAQQYVYKNRATLNAALGLVYEDLSSSIERLAIPTHIIWGEDDRVAPLRTGKLLAGQLSHAQLHIIANAGHVPMHDQPQQFMGVLNEALTQEPILAKGRPDIARKSQNYTCTKQRGIEITGDYQHMSFSNCHYIDLKNVRASSIFIEDSIVSIENSDFNSRSTALTSIRSHVTMTNVDLNGDEGAMWVDDSLVDSAGVFFNGKQSPIIVASPSQLYFSVSSLLENAQKKPLHGMSMGNKLELK